ncbi:hypothetical protein B0H14DRAFT_2584518 [Mycena olivaceomarginata]|nr:hypothetical protein B0H14DRAFT_2584518 [Mycena olivaceomarginata]
MPMSSAAVTTVVLENPRHIPKTNSIVFDAQIYLGSSEPAIIASLRYFNTDISSRPKKLDEVPPGRTSSSDSSSTSKTSTLGGGAAEAVLDFFFGWSAVRHHRSWSDLVTGLDSDY